MNKNSRLVYSTDEGRTDKGRTDKGRTDRGRIRESAPAPAAPRGDGIVRIRRETSGRKGKGVTTVAGLPVDETIIRKLARELKQLCGTGGTVKNHIIEIQGDHREKIRAELEKQGYRVKLAGG